MTWAGVLQTIVMGTVTLLSAVLGGWLSRKTARQTQDAQIQAETRQRRADKYEEIVAALYDLDHWLNALRESETLGKSMALEGTTPFAKIEAIATVYFPEISTQVRSLHSALPDYHIWLLKDAKAATHGNRLEGHKEAHKPYARAFANLLNAVQEAASKEFS